MSATALSPTTNSAEIRQSDLRVQPRTLATAGAAALLAAVIVAYASGSGFRHLAHSYLVSFSFFLSVSLGALFFVVLQHLTGARWSVAIRRVAELTTTPLAALAVLVLPIMLPLFFGSPVLFEWNDQELRNTDVFVQGKAPYLNPPFFALRCILYFAAWIGISNLFLRWSVRQDSSAQFALTQKMRRFSGPAMLGLAVTINFAAFDWLMSLDPHWFSTIFGIYFFAGSAVAIFAFLAIATSLLQSCGYLRSEITTEHYHDLGKLLFGFMFFWAYIAFSQYLLIWYANIPEETGWFYARQNGGWQIFSVALILGHFVMPFFGLMSRGARRDRRVLLFWSAVLLVMHWIDIFWLVMPSFSDTAVSPGLFDLLCFAGVALIWLASMLRNATAIRLVPTGDPFLRESLAFHNH
jgi:hypothetical protein